MPQPIVFEWVDSHSIRERDYFDDTVSEHNVNEHCNIHFDKRIKMDSALHIALKQCKGVDSLFIHDSTLNYHTSESIGTYKAELYRSKCFERVEVEDAITAEYLQWVNDCTLLSS